MSQHIQYARRKISQLKPYWLALQNNENDLQDLDLLPELPRGGCADIFKKNAKMYLWHIFATFLLWECQRHNYSRGPEVCPSENFRKITLKYTKF